MEMRPVPCPECGYVGVVPRLHDDDGRPLASISSHRSPECGAVFVVDLDGSTRLPNERDIAGLNGGNREMVARWLRDAS